MSNAKKSKKKNRMEAIMYRDCDVSHGKLMGATDTDYFNFFCPECKDTQILQLLDFEVVQDGPISYAKEDRPMAQRDFRLVFEVYCPVCEFRDFFKISNTGWQGGKLKDIPYLKFEDPMVLPSS